MFKAPHLSLSRRHVQIQWWVLFPAESILARFARSCFAELLFPGSIPCPLPTVSYRGRQLQIRSLRLPSEANGWELVDYLPGCRQPDFLGWLEACSSSAKGGLGYLLSLFLPFLRESGRTLRRFRHKARQQAFRQGLHALLSITRRRRLLFRATSERADEAVEHRFRRVREI